MNCKRSSNQSGVALISVILITAMITTMTIAMAISQTYNTQKARNLLTKDRVILLLEETEQRAIVEIIERRKLGNKDEQDFSDEGGGISLSRDGLRADANLQSLNARFNLNNLDDAFGARAVRSASSAGQARRDPDAAVSPGADNARFGDSSPRSGENTADNSSASRSPQQTPASPRLCNDTLNCAWWQYAPQGYVDEVRDVDSADPNGGGLNPRPASANLPVTRQAGGQPTTVVAPGAAPAQANQANLGQVQLSPQELAEMRLANLFRALDLDTNLIPALLDWIDEDSETRYPNGAEDDYYMNLEQPYRAANQGLASLRELLLIKGFDRKIYETLLPHLSILSRATKININTATQEVLMSLSPLIDSGTAEMLIASREVQPFQSIQAFLQHPLARGRFVNEEGLSVESDFYQLDASLQSERTSISASSHLFYSNLQATAIKRTIGYVQ